MPCCNPVDPREYRLGASTGLVAGLKRTAREVSQTTQPARVGW